MALATLDNLDDIKSKDIYQKQLNVIYQSIKFNNYTELSVLIDFNAYGNAVLELLPHSKQLNPEPLKRIHHSFEDDLVLINIPITNTCGQRQLEQLLAIALFENLYDLAEHTMSRSVCLWMFNQPVTDTLKESLFKLGRVKDFKTNKERYLRYWDPRVLSIMHYIWNHKQKLKIKEMGIESIYYVDWNNELVIFKLPFKVQIFKNAKEKQLFKQMNQPPFRFNQQQWSILIQVEWINMIIRQLKEVININSSIYKIIIPQASKITTNTVTTDVAIDDINKELSNFGVD